MQSPLTPEEQVVVEYLSKVARTETGEEDPQQVIDCVENDVDLAKVVRETLEPAELQIFRMMAHEWFNGHPQYREQLRDPDKVALRIADALERVNPTIAKALLEGPKVFSASELGLEVVSGSVDANSADPAQQGLDYPRAGIEYLKRTVQRFRRLFYI